MGLNKDKQIEEMANDLAKICPDLVENCCGQINCVTHLTLSLSKMGYRKASEVAREIFEEIEKCSEVALMNGHIETPILCIGFGVLAELKKKYTESEKDNGNI